jgi:hypothetical protein
MYLSDCFYIIEIPLFANLRHKVLVFMLAVFISVFGG